MAVKVIDIKLESLTVKEYGAAAGANLVGIASAEDFGSAPEGFKPSYLLEGCRSVIVLGASFSKGVLGDAAEYTASRNAMLTKMTEIAKAVAKRVKAHGYNVKAISASGGKTIDGKLFGHISLKHAAELAGLGHIGRNYLLTNRDYGNLIWLSAVLTDAQLFPDGQAEKTICTGCGKCVEACPSGALNDPAAFGKKECSKFFVIEDRKFKIKCFLCRTICPYGQGSGI